MGDGPAFSRVWQIIFNPWFALLVTALAAAGALVGATLSHGSSPDTLRQWFAAFVLAVALFLTFMNCGALA